MQNKRRTAHNKRKIKVKYLGHSSYQYENYQITNVLSFVRSFTSILALTLICVAIGNYNVEQDLINPLISINEVEVQAKEVEPTPTTEPEWKVAKITAYSCNGIKDDYHLMMNCPSVKWYGEPKTANGTTPIVDKTMACDKANMGRTFEIKGVGLRTCSDTGGAIKGAGRFDLYVKDINTAYSWGVQELEYRLIEE